MSKKAPFSATSLDAYLNNPVKKLFETYVERKGRESKNYHMSTVGTELHTFTTKAFEFLQSKKATFDKGSVPTDTLVNQLISQSEKHAESSLRLNTSKFMKQKAMDTVRRYAPEYLKNPDMYVYPAHRFDGTITDSSTGKVHEITGEQDLVIADIRKKTAEIVDQKFLSNSADMNKFDNASSLTQSKMYSLDILKHGIGGNQIDNVNMVYAVASPDMTTKFTDSVTYDKQMLADIETDLALAASQAENLRTMTYNKIREQGNVLGGFSDAYKDVMLKGLCKPGINCNFCAIRFSCNLKFVSDVGYKLQNMRGNGGEVGLDSMMNNLDEKDQAIMEEFNKARDLDKKEYTNIYSELYDSSTDVLKSDYTLGRYKELKKKGISGVEAYRISKNEQELLSKSLDLVKKQTRGQFQDSVLTGATAARERLPFPVSDPISSGYQHSWLHPRLAESVKQLTYDTVNETLDKLEIYQPAAQADRIVEKLFTNGEFVNRFSNSIQDNAVKAMYRKGMIPSINNLKNEMKNVKSMLSNDASTILMDGINKSIVEDVLVYSSDRLRSKIPFRDGFEKSNQKALFDSMASEGILNNNIDAFRKRISEVDSAFAKNQRFSLTAPRYFMSTMAKAFVLTSLASNETISRMVQNKIDKVTSFINSQDQGIDTGTHNSTYTVMRRMLLSDFGSKRRPFNPVSSIFSKYAAKGGSALKRVGEVVRDTYTRTLTEDINPKHLSTGSSALFYGASAAAIAFTLTSLVPRMPTREEKQRIDYKKKVELKKRQQVNPTGDSNTQNPQSTYRDRYKLHTQFGSPASLAAGALRILKSIPLGEVIDYVKGIDKNVISRSISYVGRSFTNVIRKGMALEVAEYTSDEAVFNAEQYVRKAAKLSSSEVVKYSTHNIDKIKNRVVREYRDKTLYKHTKRRLSGYMNDKKMEKITERIRQDSHNYIPVSMLSNPYPVIMKHPKGKRETIVTSVKQKRAGEEVRPVVKSVNPRRGYAGILPSTGVKSLPYAVTSSTINELNVPDFSSIYIPHNKMKAVAADFKTNKGRMESGYYDSIPEYKNISGNYENIVVDSGRSIEGTSKLAVDSMRKPKKGSPIGGARAWDERSMVGGAFI